jgi:hypothetical protein
MRLLGESAKILIFKFTMSPIKNDLLAKELWDGLKFIFNLLVNVIKDHVLQICCAGNFHWEMHDLLRINPYSSGLETQIPKVE